MAERWSIGFKSSIAAHNITRHKMCYVVPRMFCTRSLFVTRELKRASMYPTSMKYHRILVASSRHLRKDNARVVVSHVLVLHSNPVDLSNRRPTTTAGGKSKTDC